MSGYDLMKTFDSTLAHVWSAKHSQIYPELASMLEDGLVKVRPAGSRGRREYSITTSGRQEIVRWLTDEALRPSASRNEPLLRTFFLGYVAPDQAKGLLQGIRDRSAARLAEYERERAVEVSESVRAQGWTGHIPLEAGIRWARTMVEWADWAIEEVDRLTPAATDKAGRASGRPAGRARPRKTAKSQASKTTRHS
jgi:PadR family transcriptional regulator AphA